MRILKETGRAVVVAALIGLAAATVAAHPGSGLVVDRRGTVYFLDTGSGVWAIDGGGALSRRPGPNFHWMALDEGDRFASARLPSGSGGEIVRAGSRPTLLLASDFPVAVARDGPLYYPKPGPDGAI